MAHTIRGVARQFTALMRSLDRTERAAAKLELMKRRAGSITLPKSKVRRLEEPKELPKK